MNIVHVFLLSQGSDVTFREGTPRHSVLETLRLRSGRTEFPAFPRFRIGGRNDPPQADRLPSGGGGWEGRYTCLWVCGLQSGYSVAGPGDGFEAQLEADIPEYILDELFAWLRSALGNAGLGGDGADEQLDGLEKEGMVIGVVDHDLVEPQADDGGLLADAFELSGVGEPPPASVTHSRCVKRSMGRTGLGVAGESVCQFGSPLNVLADVYGLGRNDLG